MTFLVAHIVHKHCALSSLINDAACLRKIVWKYKITQLFYIKNVCFRQSAIYAGALHCKAVCRAHLLSSREINLVNLYFPFEANILTVQKWTFMWNDIAAPRNDSMMMQSESIPSPTWAKSLSGVAAKYALTFRFIPSPSPRDLLRIGVTLAGHQKKILSNIQSMRVQMSQSPTTLAWLQGALCHGTGSIRRNNNGGSLRMTPDPSDRARVETIVLI